MKDIVADLQSLSALKKIQPNPEWKEKTLQSLLLQYDDKISTAGEHSAIAADPLPTWRWSVALVPAFAVILIAMFAAAPSQDGSEGTGVNTPSFPGTVKPIAVNPNLPMATSVQSPSTSTTSLPILATNTPVKYAVPSIRRTQKTRRPVASTRLAMSVQSLPQAPWVFSDKSPGQHARWVFSERGVNSNGS